MSPPKTNEYWGLNNEYLWYKFSWTSIFNTNFNLGVESVMKEALIVAIVIGGLVLIPAVIGGTIIISIKLLKGGATRKDHAEDSKIIQEIYQGLSRMEKRVEALETILLDREKRGRHHE